MHNRARLVVGSFLTKDLASTGAGASAGSCACCSTATRPATTATGSGSPRSAPTRSPPFRRIYNPARQQERFDPDGAYVRRYVPELARRARRVPARAVDDAARRSSAEAGCVIGRDYPEPIVDHAEARREALERYADAV